MWRALVGGCRLLRSLSAAPVVGGAAARGAGGGGAAAEAAERRQEAGRARVWAVIECCRGREPGGWMRSRVRGPSVAVLARSYRSFGSVFVSVNAERGFVVLLGLCYRSAVPADTSLPKFSIDFVVNLLRQENAKDICVIQVPPEVKYCNYFIVVSGSSTRHLHAMAHYMLKMYKHQKKESDPHTRIEGKETDDWLCIDFGSMVIHFMLPETRETYELEKLWTLGSYDDQLAQMTPQLLPEDFILGLTSEEQ
uniref:Mitochondrial assembly of ribosomal large subunit protein 1 n=1 Tax=Phasianus colchicus TaxID=9054 RepID=A0A669P823_PHACC